MRSRSLVALIVCAALTTQCAGVRAAQRQPAPQTAPGTSATGVLAAAERIPVGSRVRVTLDGGRRMTAVLLGVDGDEVVVRERTRIPEPPLRLAADRISWIEVDAGRMGFGKMIAIGAAIGAGVTLALLAVLAASIDD